MEIVENQSSWPFWHYDALPGIDGSHRPRASDSFFDDRKVSKNFVEHWGPARSVRRDVYGQPRVLATHGESHVCSAVDVLCELHLEARDSFHLGFNDEVVTADQATQIVDLVSTNHKANVLFKQIVDVDPDGVKVVFTGLFHVVDVGCCVNPTKAIDFVVTHLGVPY